MAVLYNLSSGHPIFLGQNDIQMASGEPISTTSKVISSMVDCIIARLDEHKDLESLALNSSVPVINALTDKYHPLQILADLCTIQEIYEKRKIKIAWIGDSNNVLNSMLVTYPRLGYQLSVATPKEYPVDKSMISKDGPKVFITNDPVEACRDADIIMTDTWVCKIFIKVSMGQAIDYEKTIKFKGFQVTEELGRVAKKDWKFMHCLPRYSLEVDDEGKQWD
jgi:ornithine carbamoyltransferase